MDTLVVATKATGLRRRSSASRPRRELVLPLLNGLDHLALLRERFGEETVIAGTIRVEADRPEPGVVVHTSPFLRVDMACAYPAARPAMERLARRLRNAGVPARVEESEPQVVWGKLVRLNALACTTSAYDKLLGEILSTPELRAELVGAIEEGCAVAAAEGASIDASDPLGELERGPPHAGELDAARPRGGPRPGARRDPRRGAARGRPPRAGVPDDRTAGGKHRQARGRAPADPCTLSERSRSPATGLRRPSAAPTLHGPLRRTT